MGSYQSWYIHWFNRTIISTNYKGSVVVSFISAFHCWDHAVFVHQAHECLGTVGSSCTMASDGDTNELGETHTGEHEELEKNS